MSDMENLQLFEDQAIRTAWNEEEEEWYFSVVDVVGALTDQPDIRRAAKYWSVLKVRIKAEGNELTTNCSQLKLKAADGKRRLNDVANTEQLLRIIQSIPSKKAEPFKLWLAQVGRERIEETMDPELIAERLVATYERKGYSLLEELIRFLRKYLLRLLHDEVYPQMLCLNLRCVYGQFHVIR